MSDEKKKEQLIDELIKLEWNAFDNVRNEGGRAGCQDDFQTFSIMRRSQYMTWPNAMIESFTRDFNTANLRGWNLIMEKYGRMMKSTAPKEYEKLKEQFPPITSEKNQIIEAIVAIQTSMLEEFAKEYPNMAGNARSIHTADDTELNTSAETYLRGEISTYSDETLDMYGRFLAEYAKKNKNLVKEIMENTAHLYGYSSLEAAEKSK